MRRLLSLRAAAFLAGGIALLSGIPAPAHASDMSMTHNSTTWNGNQFTISVTVTNNAPNGSGAVVVDASGSAGVTNVTVEGGQDGGGGAQIPGGESHNFQVKGTCSGSSGTVTIEYTYSKDGRIVTDELEVQLNKPLSTGRPVVQPGEPIGH